MKKYTVEEILKAAEIGETSIIDAKHICSLLDEAKQILKQGFDCRECIKYFSNPFDQYYCELDYNIENNKTCKGKHFEKNNQRFGFSK